MSREKLVRMKTKVAEVMALLTVVEQKLESLTEQQLESGQTYDVDVLLKEAMETNTQFDRTLMQSAIAFTIEERFSESGVEVDSAKMAKDCLVRFYSWAAEYTPEIGDDGDFFAYVVIKERATEYDLVEGIYIGAGLEELYPGGMVCQSDQLEWLR